MTVKKGKLEMEVNLVSKNVMTVKTSANMRPKNRKQKKLWKQESYSMKKVEKGLYKITQYCDIEVNMLPQFGIRNSI